MVLLLFAGFTKLSKKIGDRCQRRLRTYGNCKHLKRRMLSLHPAYSDFVSGPKCGEPTFFFCRLCHRDVRMKAQESGEFKRHFSSDGHWFRERAPEYQLNWSRAETVVSRNITYFVWPLGL